MRKIIIIGGGGHAKVLIDAILSSDRFKIDGVLDPNLKIGSQLIAIPVLGADDFTESLNIKDFCLALGVGSIKSTDVRKTIFEKYINKGFEFPVIVHKRAYISKNSYISSGAQVMAGAIIQPDVFIGENVIINTASVIEHDSKISAHCHISPGVVIGGNVEIGECSHIGLGARVMQGVRIGKNVTVGAGAVVISNVGDGKTVIGVPAK